MHKVDQALLSEGGGDCVRACVATLTERPRALVPDFCAEHGASWLRALSAWLLERGWRVLLVPPWLARVWPFSIALGPSSHGRHAVVHRFGRLFHDPNPHYGRAGIERVERALVLLRCD